jgi:hypothetical protein
VIKYVKDGRNWTMNAECVADFVDGSLSVSYDDAVAGEAVVQEEAQEETIEEIDGEIIEDVAEQTEEVIEEIVAE